MGRTRMTNLFFVEFYAGIIPESLGNLENLQELDLYGNQLSGHFFIFRGGQCPLTNLFFVQFHAGRIPESIGNLANLEELVLWGNELSGPISRF